MSGYIPTALAMAPISGSRCGIVLDNLYQFLVEAHNFSGELESKLHKLHLDAPDLPWGYPGSQPIRATSFVQALRTEPAVMMEGSVVIGDYSDYIGLFVYPFPNRSGAHGVSMRLASTFLEAVYRDSGFNEQQAIALRNFVIGVATQLETDAFELVLETDDIAPFAQRDSSAVVGHIMRPSVENLKAEPKYVIGIRADLVSMPGIVKLWGNEYVARTTHGYVVIDLLKEREPVNP